MIKKYLRTWERLLSQPIETATLPKTKREDILPAWGFFSINFGLLAIVDTVYLSLHEGRFVRIPSKNWVAGASVVLFWLGIYFLLGLVRARAQGGTRPSARRLLDGLLFMMGGPALLYSLLILLLGVGWLWIAPDSTGQTGLLIFVFLLLAIAFMQLTYCVRVVHALYMVDRLLLFAVGIILWTIGSFLVMALYFTVSSGTLSERERDILEEVKAGSIAEAIFVHKKGKCGDLSELKEYFTLARILRFRHFPRLFRALARFASDEYVEEMHGYRLHFAREESECAVEATPIKYGDDTRWSFYVPPSAWGWPVHVADDEGRHANIRDKLLRELPAVPVNDD